MKYVAFLALMLVALGLPTVNINHYLHLPSVQTIIDSDGIVVHEEGLFVRHQHIDITLNDEIKSPQHFKAIDKVLREANYGDTITFHMVGYGGDVESVVLLLNNIHMSKAKVNMSVEGNVYSGHAYLASLGGDLTMQPDTYLMLHTFSGYGTDCTQEDGIDRTVPNVEHCQAMINAMQAEVTDLVMRITFLTYNEKIAILTGHDVYINDVEFNKRVLNMKDATESSSNLIMIPLPKKMPAMSIYN